MPNRRIISFRFKSSSATVIVLPDGTGRLTNVYSEDRGHGHATALMQEIAKFADKEGVELRLVPKRYGYADKKSPSNPQLIEFYKKHGFELVTELPEPTMVRPVTPQNG